MGELAQRRWARLLGWFAALTLYPFTILFPFYWSMEGAYGIAQGSGKHPPVVELLRNRAQVLEGLQLYTCDQWDSSRSTALPPPERSAASAILHSLGETRVHHPFNDEAPPWDWLRHLDLPFFRAGYALYDIDGALADHAYEIRTALWNHCTAQRERVETGLAEQPIAIYAEARSALLESAKRFETTLHSYEAIRLPLGLAMWSWALIELVGLSLFAVQFRAAWRHLRSQA